MNGSSLLGRHGIGIRELAWDLVERGLAGLVASDGHRQARPPHLDEAYALARERMGEEADALVRRDARSGASSPTDSISRKHASRLSESISI